MKKSPNRYLLLLFALFVAASGFSAIRIAAEESPPAPKPATVFQLSTLPALSLGLYDGTMTMGQLLKHGDTGLGTLDALDGEVIILKGKAYQIRSDGKIVQLTSKALTPFAVVTRITSPRTYPIAGVNYADLKLRLVKEMPTPNVPYAFEIKGFFTTIKTRSVPRQSKPYRPLVEVTKTQSVFEFQNVRGTLIGFRFPAYLSGVNLADYHFHFLSDDKRSGGHVLDCNLQQGEVKVQRLSNVEMALPQDKDFDEADLSTDQSEDLHKAEQGH